MIFWRLWLFSAAGVAKAISGHNEYIDGTLQESFHRRSDHHADDRSDIQEATISSMGTVRREGYADLQLQPLDLFSDICSSPDAECLRRAGSRVHRTVLVLGLQKPVPTLHGKSGYYPMYIDLEDSVAESMFKLGYASLVWPRDRCDKLNFTDFAVDVVLVNPSRWQGENCAGSKALHEIVRLLAPGGQLVLASQAEEVKSELLKLNVPASALLQPTSFSNVFLRVDRRVGSLQDCEACGLDKSASATGKCQPYLQPDYLPATDPKRSMAISDEASLSKGRLHNWPLKNVLGSQKEDQWVDQFYKAKPEWFKANYVKKDGIRKKELSGEILKLLQKAHSLLDAGAGSCTLEAWLRETDKFEHLKPMMSFGAYDCSMLRICAERGSISFQHDWLQTLPMCNRCKFELVMQLEGIHHMSSRELIEKTVDALAARLECGGSLYIADISSNHPDLNWTSIAEHRLLAASHEVKLGRLKKQKTLTLLAKKTAAACHSSEVKNTAVFAGDAIGHPDIAFSASE
mmetsp:Transcript_42759/g.76916  ORF Transcript_42759/g.76916 Transcript_42759/m.76916 type:complete len:517 (+) Transcript_42759:73-1623(+)